MKHRRIKITGIGPVTSAGIGREAFLRGMLEPVSRVGLVKIAGNGEHVTAAAEVKNFRIGAFALDASCLRSSRHTQFALAATALALSDAGLTLTEVRKRKPLVLIASLHPEAGAAVTKQVGARDEAIPTGSALEAIGRAADRIAKGEIDLAICGGVETPLLPEFVERLIKEGLAPKHARDPARQCRPFDLWRTTGAPAEGACMFVLEAEQSPRRAYVRVAGWAQAEDEAHKPWTGLREALRLGLANAGLRTDGIDCIHTEGTGKKLLDAAEAAALNRAFGARLETISAVANKGALGNALGAAGAIQVGCAALSMRHSIIPPSINRRHPDPACPLNLFPSSRPLAMETSLIIERGRSETVTCLLLKV